MDMDGEDDEEEETKYFKRNLNGQTSTQTSVEPVF